MVTQVFQELGEAEAQIQKRLFAGLGLKGKRYFVESDKLAQENQVYNFEHYNFNSDSL